ncbi:hypothetical protein Ndes2437B_g07932 [Nannochloris sp. 'desiccata']
MGVVDDYYGGYETLHMFTKNGETDFDAAYTYANKLDRYDQPTKDTAKQSSNAKQGTNAKQGQITQTVGGFSSGSLEATFQNVQPIADPTSPQVPVAPSQIKLMFAQKEHIMDLEQRIKDAEEDLEREIALRKQFELEATYTNAACEAFFETTWQLSQTVTATERHLELKILAMQHSIAVWETWGLQNGVFIVKHGGIEAVTSLEDCASSI